MPALPPWVFSPVVQEALTTRPRGRNAPRHRARCSGVDPSGETSSTPNPTTTPTTTAAPATCVTMKGDFDASAWQGLVDSLPQNQVQSDTGFSLAGILRAQVYENSSWVTVGESASLSLYGQDKVMSFGGTGYPPDSQRQGCLHLVPTGRRNTVPTRRRLL